MVRCAWWIARTLAPDPRTVIRSDRTVALRTVAPSDRAKLHRAEFFADPPESLLRGTIPELARKLAAIAVEAACDSIDRRIARQPHGGIRALFQGATGSAAIRLTNRRREIARQLRAGHEARRHRVHRRATRQARGKRPGPEPITGLRLAISGECIIRRRVTANHRNRGRLQTTMQTTTDKSRRSGKSIEELACRGRRTSEHVGRKRHLDAVHALAPLTL